MCIFKALHMYDEGDASHSDGKGDTSPDGKGDASHSDGKGSECLRIFSSDAVSLCCLLPTLRSSTEGAEDASPSDGKGDTSPSDGKGDTSPSDGKGDTSPSDGKGDTSPSDGKGDTSHSDDEGAKDLSLKQFYGFYEVINLEWKRVCCFVSVGLVTEIHGDRYPRTGRS